MGDVPRQGRPIKIISVQHLERKETCLGQDRVDTGAAMPFTEHESIPVWPGWLTRSNPQNATVQNSNQFAHRIVGSDVSTSRPLDHSQYVKTNSMSQRFNFPGTEQSQIFVHPNS